MKHKLNRLTALLLAVIMAFSMLLVPVEATSFADVSAKAWYKSAVDFVSEKGLMAGVSETRFAPETNMTRAMFVTVLARYAGVTVKNDTTVFSDVRKDKWYTGAVTWAAQQGLVSGVGDGRFAPNAEITRQDLCTILCKFLSMEDVVLKRGEGKTFTDANKIASYAKEAVAFCAQTGLIAGFEDGSFGSKKTATRAQVAAILKKLWTLTGGPVLRPAQTLREGDAGVSVTVDAPRGALPEDTDLTVTRVTDEATLAELAKKANGKLIAAADITFSKSGAELEPKTEVEVQIALDGLEDVKNPTVCHVRADGTLEYVSSEQVSLNRSAGSKALRFFAKDFSVYAVLDTPTNPTVTVKFYDRDGSTLLNQQIISVKRLENAVPEDLIVYDPGISSVSESEEFDGWAATSGATAGKTIETINDDLVNLFQGTGLKQYEFSYYPVLHTVARLRYLDQTGEVLDAEVYRFSSGSVQVDVSRLYTPLASNQFFTNEWVVKTEATTFGEGQNSVPSDYGTGARYDVGNKITLNAGDTVDLIPMLQTGGFVFFDMNITAENAINGIVGSEDTPARYLAPVFAQAGGTVTLPTANDSTEANRPYREGYTFGGWYRTSDTRIDQDKITTNTVTIDSSNPTNITVYAKWVPASVTYYIIHEHQSLSDVVDLDDSQKTFEYYSVEKKTALTGSWISLDSVAGLKDADGYFFIFNANRSTSGSVQVRGDGSTILHARYDRRVITAYIVDREYSEEATNYESVDPDALSVNDLYRRTDKLGNAVGDRADDGFVYLHVYGGYPDDYSTPVIDDGKVTYNETVSSGQAEFKEEPFKTTSVPVDNVVKLKIPATDNQYFITHRGLYGQSFALGNVLPNEGSPDYERLFHWVHSVNGYSLMFNDDLDANSPFLYDTELSVVEPDRSTMFYIVRKHIATTDYHVYSHVMDEEGNYQIGYVTVNGKSKQAWVNPDDMTVPYKHQLVQQLRNKPFTLTHVVPGTYAYYLTENTRYSTASSLLQTQPDGTIVLQIAPSTQNQEGYVEYNVMDNIHFWWERDQYDIDYVENGGSSVPTVRDYYEADVSTAGNAVTTREDYLFLGWYVDESLTVPWEDYAEKIDNKMPIDGFALYAKWAPLQYRVHLNYFDSDDADSAEEVRFAARSFQTTWLLRTGEKIPIPDNRLATRPGYVFDGWYYKDSEGNEKPFSDDTVVSRGLADEDYGQKRDDESDAAFQYRMRVYGERTGVDQVTGVPYDDRWNNKNPEREAIVGRIELYARWRKVTYEGLGIQVRYLPNASDGVSGSFPDGTLTETDGTHLEKEKYNDGDKAFGYPASTANRADMHFLYWELMDSEGNRTGTKVYPGATFDIDIEDAMRERTYEPGYEPNYTEELRHTHNLTAVEANPVATCSQPAHEAGWYCADCDTYFTDDQGENIMTVTGGEHNWVKISQTGYCTEAGTSTMRCSYCGREKVVARAAGSHTLSYEDVLPTCTEEGYTGGSHCTVPGCGYSVASTVVSPLGHDWKLDQTTTAPTCTQTGLGSAHCDRCNERINDSVIPAKGHLYDGAKTYTWEISADNGSNWIPVSGTPVIEFGNLSNYQLRCTASTSCTRPDCDHGANAVMTRQVTVSTCTHASDPVYGTDVTGTYSASFDAPFAGPQTQNVTLHVSKRVVTCVYPNGGSLTRLGDLGPSDTVTLPSKSDLPAAAQTIGNYEVIGWIVGTYDSTTAPSSYFALGAQVHFDENTTVNALYQGTFDSTVYKPASSLSDGSKYVITSGQTSGYILKSNGNGNDFDSDAMELNSSNYLINVSDSCEFTYKVGTGTFRSFLDKDGNYLTAHNKTMRSGYTGNYQNHYVNASDPGFTVGNSATYRYLAWNGSSFAFSSTSKTTLYFWYKSGGASYKYKTAPGDGLSAVSDELASARTINLPETNASVLRDHSASQTFVSRTAPATEEADGKAEPANAAPAEAAAQTNTATPKVNVTPKGTGEQTGHKLTVLYRYRNDENELVPFQYKDYGEAARGLEFYYEANENYCLLNPEFLGYTAETKLTQGKMPDSDLTVTVVYTRNQIEAPANEKWVLETSSTLDPNEEYLIVAVSNYHYATVGMLQAKQTGSNLVGAAPYFRHILMTERVDVTPGWMALPQPLGNTLIVSGWTAMNNPDDYSDSFYIDSAYEFGDLFDHYEWKTGENGGLYEYFNGEGWTDKTVDLKSCIWKVRQVEGGGYVIDSASDPNYHLNWEDSGVFPSNTDSDIWYYDSTNHSLKAQFTSSSETMEIYLSIEYPLDFDVLNTFEDDPNFTVQHLTEAGLDYKYDRHPYAFIQVDPENVDDLNSKVFFFKRESAAEHTVVLRDDKGVAFTSFTVPHGGSLSTYMPSTVAPEGYTVKSWTEADGTEYEVSSGNGAMMSQAVPTRGGFQTNGFDSVTVTKNMDFTAEYEPHFTQTYEIQLRATYGPYSEDGKTHIYWYANNGTGKNNGGGARVMDTAVVPYESAVQIPVPSAATTPESVPGMLTENRVFYEGISGRGSSDVETGVVGEAEVGLNYPGHIFLGWVKFDEENNEIGEAHEELRTLNPNNPEDMAKLALIWDGEKYTYNPDIMVPKGYVGGTSGDGPDAAVNPTRGPVANGTENVTATVKADSTFPYQKFVAAYAVQVDYFYVFHSATGVLERRELNYQDVDDGNGGTVRKATPVDLTTAVAPGHRYGGYYHTYGGVNTNKIDEVVENPYATWETSGLSTSASGLIALIDALERMGDNLTQADAEKIVEELSTNKTLILISKLLEAEWPDERLQHFPKEDLIEAVTNPSGAFADVNVDALLQSLAENAQWTEERRTNFLSKFPANELIFDITGTHQNTTGDDVPNLDDEKVNALIELLDDADKLTVSKKTNVLSMFRTEVIDSLTEAEKNALIRSIDNTVDPTAWTEDQKNSFLDTHNVTGAMLHAVLTPAREKTVIEAVVNPSGWNGPGRNAQVSDFLNLFTSDELADRLIKVLPDEEADDMIERLVENTKISPTAKQELLDSFAGSELADALGRTLQDFTAIERFADLEASSSYWTNDKMEQILSTFCGASVVNALLTTDSEQDEQAVVTIDELKLIFDTVGYPDGYTSETIGQASIATITSALSALTPEEIQKLDALTNQGVTGILETDGVDGFGFEPYAGAKTFTQDGTNKNFWTKSQAYNVANATPETPAADINGQTMRPVKDTVYYLKEVPEVYLSSKYYFTYKNGETGDLSTATIRGISMVTLVDDTYYKQYGFKVDNLANTEEGYVTYKGVATKKFVISKTGDGTQTQSINVTAATFGAPAGSVVPVQWKEETMGEDFNSVPMWTTLDGVDVVATENERHIDVNNPLDCLSKRMKLDLEHATANGGPWLADGFQTKVCIYDGNGTDARWLDVNVNNRIMIPDLGAHYKKIQIVRYADANAAFFDGNNGDLTKADAYTAIFDINYSVDEITSIEGSKPNNG